MGELLETPQIYSLNEATMIVQFANSIDPKTQRRILSLIDLLESSRFSGFVECIPSYTGVAVFYNPAKVHLDTRFSPSDVVRELLEQAVDASHHLTPSNEGSVIDLPVCYDVRLGPDLEEVARYNNLSMDEVISIHSSGHYHVYMIGFAPGFPFLGGMDEAIATPRKQQPRFQIPAGSVGIAGKQTGVYPMVTPGGWQLIGRTPLTMFDLDREEPSLLKPGQVVTFKPISLEEYQDLKERE